MRSALIGLLTVAFLVLKASIAYALATQLVLQSAHHNYLNSVIFTKSGQQLISGGADTTAILWDVNSGRTIRRFPHGDLIICIALSKDGKQMLTAGRGLVVWNLATGAEIRRFATFGDIDAAEFSPDGKRIVASSPRGVGVWEIATGTLLRSLAAHPSELSTMAMSSDGQRLIFGDDSGQLRLWDVALDHEILVFEGTSQRYLSLMFSQDGHWAVAGAESGLVRLLDIESGKEVRRFEGPKSWANSVAFSPDGKTVVAGSSEGKVFAWATATGDPLWTLDGLAKTTVKVAVDPTGSRVGVTSYLQIQTLEIKSGQPTQYFESKGKAITSVAFQPGGRHMITAGLDNSPSLWDLTSGAVVKRFVGHSPGVQSEGVTAAAFSADGTQVLTGGGDNTARLWDVNIGKEIRKLEGHTDTVTSVAFSPDQKQLLTGSDDRTARLWDRESGTAIRQFTGNSGLITTVAFSHDGTQIITGGSDAAIWLWDAATGTRLREYVGLSRSQPISFNETIDVRHNQVRSYERRSGEVLSLAVSPDGTQLIAGSRSGFAFIWDSTTGAVLQRLLCGSDVTAVNFTTDGRWAVTGSADNLIRVWDPHTGQEVQRLAGHVDEVNSVTSSADGRWLLSGSRDGTAAIWSLQTGKRMATLGSLAQGGWIAVSEDGRFDTSELDGEAPISWLVSDEPFRPLPPEILMRDYYQPKLLSRLLTDKVGASPPVRDIATLYRVQPTVKIISVTRGSLASEALVDVSVSMSSSPKQADAAQIFHAAYDLRLFRNGQLVGQWPEPHGGTAGPDDIAAWRASRRVPAAANETHATHRFTVNLASSDRGQPVIFTAYAFNEDRVKSATVKHDSYRVSTDIETRPKRVFVLTIGINDYHAPGHDLEFAAKDAQVMAEALGKIKDHEVVPITLVTDKAHDGVGAINRATKANIRAVFEVLAGKADAWQERERLRAAGVDSKAIAKLDKVTPDDAVIITYSGHGYTERTGAFYLLPAGSWAGETITPASLPKFISSDELSEWLRDVDAGEMAMVIDACHSAASVDIPGFKPGPMGDRGLGQLAYDKGMRILAATQSDDVALEIRDLKEGLLTYALVEDGLTRDSAGKLPASPDGTGVVTLSAWLKYGEQRTPGLYEDAAQHKVTVKPRDSSVDPAFLPTFLAAQQKHRQTPALFDFYRLRESVELQPGSSGSGP